MALINEITYAIRTVATSNPFLCTEISLNMLCKAVVQSASITADEPGNHAEADLTAHELEVLKLMGESLTNTKIADKLFTNRRIIETYRQNIIAKTQAKNTAALIKLSVSRRLIS